MNLTKDFPGQYEKNYKSCLKNLPRLYSVANNYNHTYRHIFIYIHILNSIALYIALTCWPALPKSWHTYLYVLHLLYPFIRWGTFSCLYVLVIGNSAPIKIGVRVSFWIIVSSGCGVGLLDRMVALFLAFFEEPPYCSPKWLHQLTVPPTA